MLKNKNAGRFQPKKVFRIAAITAFIVAAIIVAATIIISQNIQKIADYLIETEFEKSEAGMVYDLTYDKINLRIFSGTVVIKGLLLSPKKAFFTSDDSLRLKNPVVFKIHIPQLKVKGLDRNFSLSLNEINLREILFTHPEITIINHLTKNEKEIGIKPPSAGRHKDKSIGVRKISVDHFEIKQGTITLLDQIRNKEMASAGSFDIGTKNLKIDLDKNLIQEATNVMKNTSFTFADIVYPLEKGFYILKLNAIIHNAGGNEIVIDSLRLIPTYDKKTFAIKLGEQTERMDLSVKTIKINHPDIFKMANGEAIEMESLLVSGINLNAFRDKNMPFDKTHFPKLPQQALANIKTAVNIPNITISDSYIIYEELTAGEAAPGKATIEINTAVISNVTNQKELMSKNGPMAWQLRGKLFDAASISLNVQFTSDLSNPDFTFSGNIGACNMEAFNMITENAANLRINSGNLQKINFDITAGEDYANGQITMQYNDLTVVPLKKDKKKKHEELTFLGDLANAVIKNSNPSSDKEATPKPAEAFFERDINKSIFNFMAKTLISGIKNTILPFATETKEKYDRKLEREGKHEARSQRRHELKEKRVEKRVP